LPLTQPEREEVSARIIHFLQDEFAPVLSKYYALGVSLSNRHPQNINNELRNAMTHMARALNAVEIGVARDELDAAMRHTERFKRDCLKVAVIYAGRDANNKIRHVEAIYHRLSPHVHIECANITRQRYGVIIDEVFGDQHSAEKWEALLLRIEKLREELIHEYPLLDPKKFRIIWPLAILWRYFSTISGFVAVAILTAAIGAAAIPHPDSFGEGVQSVILKVTGAVLKVPKRPVVANTPSIAAKPGVKAPPRSPEDIAHH